MFGRRIYGRERKNWMNVVGVCHRNLDWLIPAGVNESGLVADLGRQLVLNEVL